MPASKQQAPKKKKLLEKSDKSHKRLVTLQNQHLSVPAILSSGRRPPSGRNNMYLNQQCQLAYENQKAAEQAWKERTRVLERKHKLNKKHAHSPERIKEVPGYYLNDKKIKVLAQELEVATNLFEELSALYRRSTGHIWKPSISEQVNKPLELD